MSSRTSLLSLMALAACLGACATKDDVAAMRRPHLPPTKVALADKHDALFRSVAIYEITGAPEFRLFDGNAVITTRPTRADVTAMMRDWLSDADMLAPDMAHAKFLLTIRFEELRGPDVIPFSNKSARARTVYELRDMRTKDVVFEKSVDSAFQARMPGVTEEMVRSAVAHGVFGAALAASVNDGNLEDNAQGAVGATGLISGATAGAFASAHDSLLWNWPLAVLEGGRRAGAGAVRGLAIGAAGSGLIEESPGNLSDLEAGVAGGVVGAAAGFFGAASVGRSPDSYESPDQIGAFNGTARRAQALRGMMLQNFNRFIGGLDEAGMIQVRNAVPCDELNPGGVRGIAIIRQTRDAVGYDCPV